MRVCMYASPRARGVRRDGLASRSDAGIEDVDNPSNDAAMEEGNASWALDDLQAAGVDGNPGGANLTNKLCFGGVCFSDSMFIKNRQCEFRV